MQDAPAAPTMIVDDVQVFVEGAGDEVVVMVHGWPDTHALWDGTVGALRDRFRCCRFTLPGFREGSARRPHDLAELVALIARVADAASPDRPVVLLLHDWGCLFGYQFAMRHPQRVSRIVAVDIGDMEALAATLPARQLVAIAAYQVWLAAAWKIAGRAGDAMTRWLARQLKVPADPRAIGARMNWPYWQMWFGGRRAFRREAVPFRPDWPMLYLWGERKPFMFHSPGWPAAVAARPASRAESFRTGHWVMLDAPERFHAVVRSWLLQGG